MKKILAVFQTVFIILFSAGSVLAQTSIGNPIGANNFNQLITKIADAVATVVGPVALIMFIVAGILFLVSAGNPERINKAKTCLIYAVVGAAIALAAKGVAEFIGTIFT